MRPGRRVGMAWLVALLLAAGCTPPAQPISAAPPAPSGPSDLLEYERLIVRLTNENRAVVGLPALSADPVLTELARAHSRDMAAGLVEFGHDGFEARAAEAMAQIQVRHMAENVATNNFPTSASPQRAVQGWLGSPPHRANIEGNFEITGVGAAQAPDGYFFVTQLFGLR